MKTLTLTEAEIRMLQIILEAHHAELSPLAGQDLMVAVEDEDAKLFMDNAELFNYDDFEVVDIDNGEFHLLSGVCHFLEKIESAGE
jgi:hypothetical protein